MKKPIRVAVTGGAGQICYSLLFRIAAGEMFGPEQPVILHILEIPEGMQALRGVEMELDDCAFPLLKGIVVGSLPDQVFEGVDFAILVGAKPRSKGMERADLMAQNAKIFVAQGKALDRKGVKILVVGNPCNTNALVLLHNAKNLPHENIRAMTRLDQNRAIAQLAKKSGKTASDVKKMTIWGNHSPTMVPDYTHATIGGKAATDVIRDEAWLNGPFIEDVKKRGTAILEARGFSSAASAAHAVICSIRDWIHPTPSDDCYSAAIYSDGNPYGIHSGIFYSFPMKDNRIIANLAEDHFIQKMIRESEKELLAERDAVTPFLKG